MNPEPGRKELTAELLRRAADADDARERQRLIDEVVVLNMGVAQSLARRYRGRGQPLEDLEQAAYVGLMCAAVNFDPARGEDFLVYAVPTISGYVKKHFRDHSWIVRPPRRVQELQPRISSCTETLHQRLGRTPAAAEVAAELGVDEADVVEAMSADGCFAPTSLDLPIGEAGVSWAEQMGEDDPRLDRVETRVALAGALMTLPPSDRRLLQLRFVDGCSQHRIAAELDVNQMWVSRRLRRVLAELRRAIEDDAAVDAAA